MGDPSGREGRNGEPWIGLGGIQNVSELQGLERVQRLHGFEEEGGPEPSDGWTGGRSPCRRSKGGPEGLDDRSEKGSNEERRKRSRKEKRAARYGDSSSEEGDSPEEQRTDFEGESGRKREVEEKFGQRKGETAMERSTTVMESEEVLKSCVGPGGLRPWWLKEGKEETRPGEAE